MTPPPATSKPSIDSKGPVFEALNLTSSSMLELALITLRVFSHTVNEQSVHCSIDPKVLLRKVDARLRDAETIEYVWDL